MPVDYDRWYQNQIDLGNLPDKNGYYHYILSENKWMAADVKIDKSDMIVITTIDALPEYCYECPCYNEEHAYCQADKERRYSEYRPFWCPLKKVNNN